MALPHAVLSLASYILTHATASGSSRAASYAQLILAVIQTWVRDPHVIKTFTIQHGNVWLCRQVAMILLQLLQNTHASYSWRSALRSFLFQRKIDRSFVQSSIAASCGFSIIDIKTSRPRHTCTVPFHSCDWITDCLTGVFYRYSTCVYIINSVIRFLHGERSRLGKDFPAIRGREC